MAKATKATRAEAKTTGARRASRPRKAPPSNSTRARIVATATQRATGATAAKTPAKKTTTSPRKAKKSASAPASCR